MERMRTTATLGPREGRVRTDSAVPPDRELRDSLVLLAVTGSMFGAYAGLATVLSRLLGSG